jgi:glucose 1-dehydrogenase
MSRLAGKVAIITGGARGIGRAVAEAMVAEGASVAIGDLSGDGAAEAAEAIRAAGGTAIGRPADVSVRRDVEALVDAAEAELGLASIAFCSAGITGAGGPTGFLELADDEWDRIMEVNLRGTFLTSQIVAQRLVAADEGGSLITVSSVGAQRPMFGAPAYHTTKAAIAGLTRAMAVNLAHHGIRANGIAPGYIATQMMLDLLDDDGREQILSRVPAARFGLPTDVAGAAVFLASDESAYVTGQVLHVDGGALVQGWTPSQQPSRPPVGTEQPS